jgi:hypothetical protein
MVVMPHVSRPLIALLVGTVAFFALWIVALKPQTSGNGSGGKVPLQSAIDKAHAAVAQSNAASVAHGGTVATTPATPKTTPTSPTTAATLPPSKPASPTKPTKPKQPTEATQAARAGAAAARANAAATANRHAAAAAAVREAAVVHALHAHKVVAALFYNFRAADDRAVKRELAGISTHGGRVFKISIPLQELARYAVITYQVPVTESPTLVIIDASWHARTIVGFAAGFEIEQRIVDALSVKPK